QLEGLDHVADLDVGVRDHDTALEAFADLGHVVLLPAQREHVEVVRHDRAVAHQPDLRVAPDDARRDHAARDVAALDLAGAEDLADLGLTELTLLVDRLEHALEGRLDLFDRLVDHRVVLDLDALAVGELGGLALRADVVADDDGVRPGRQADVGLRDRTDTAVDHA